MRCYEVTHIVTEGLPLICSETARPHVLVAGKGGILNEHSGRVFVADPLAAIIESARCNGMLGVSRIMRCDYELTNSLWLVPETAAPQGSESKSALVLFSSHHLQASTPGELSFACAGDAAILLENSFMRLLEHYPGNDDGDLVERTGQAILAKLTPGSQINAIELTSHEKKTGWRKTETQTLEHHVSTVGMRLDGTVFVHYPSARARYVMRVASGAPAPRFVSEE